MIKPVDLFEFALGFKADARFIHFGTVVPREVGREITRGQFSRGTSLEQEHLIQKSCGAPTVTEGRRFSGRALGKHNGNQRPTFWK